MRRQLLDRSLLSFLLPYKNRILRTASHPDIHRPHGVTPDTTTTTFLHHVLPGLLGDPERSPRPFRSVPLFFTLNYPHYWLRLSTAIPLGHASA